ncbi:MAG: peptidylprolyl isomerase [Planctomycetaceae bacterium]
MKALHSVYFLLAVGFICSFGLMAQEQKQEAPAEDAKTEAKKEAKAEAAKDPIVEWKELDARKLAIGERLEKLQADFGAATDQETKIKIRDEFRGLLREYQTVIVPRQIELAPAVYEKDPQNFDAGEVVLQSELQKNHFDDALKLVDKLSAAGRKGPAVTQLGFVANFALHKFEKAKAILQESRKAEPLDPQSEQLLQFADDYVELWKKEQEIRAAEEKAPDDKQNPRVEFTTNRGKISLELFEDEAPNTVANFISLVEAKKYDGTKFHRVMPNFMIQGGDPNSADDDPENDGEGGPGYTIKCEAYRDDARLHFRGSLSMAHAGKDTGGSQFFITHQPTPFLNPEPKKTRNVHTVFGRVVEGMDVVDDTQIGDKIESAVVVRKRNHEYKPETQAEKSLEKLRIPKLKLDGEEGKKSEKDQNKK